MTDRGARLALLLGALLFSTGGAAIKATAIDGFALAGLRSGIAAVFLLAVSPAARRAVSLRVLPVAVAYATTMTLFVLANKATTAANAILLQSSAPLYLLAFGPLFLRERIGRRELLLFAAVAVGIACCFLDTIDPSATAPEPLRGNLYATGAGLCWALTILGLRWMGARDARSGIACVVVGNVLVAAVALPLGWPLDAGLGAASFGVQDALVLGWLGVFQIGAAYLFVTAGLRHVPAFEASLLMLAEPVLSPVWAWIFLAERPGPWTFAAGALILGASFASARKPARPLAGSPRAG